MDVGELDRTSEWSREQDKAFENALAIYPEDATDRWEKIAADVPGKTLEEIKHHYELLIDDVNLIESGGVPLPSYNSSTSHGTKASKSVRRKGIAWSQDEHNLFLLGLEKYGKGDWRSISRNSVVTRTPSQVASHAQKYYERLKNSTNNKERKRSSIHDTTSVNIRDISAPQGPITGHKNDAAASSTRKSAKQGPPAPTG